MKSKLTQCGFEKDHRVSFDYISLLQYVYTASRTQPQKQHKMLSAKHV